MEGPKNQATFNFEQYKSNSKISGQRRGNIQNPNMYIPDVVDYDNEYGREVQAAKLVGKMGSKYMRHFMDTENNENKLCDITAKTAYGNKI